MMDLHYILVVLVILAIIIAQIYIYRNTKKKIATYKSIFPNKLVTFSLIKRKSKQKETKNHMLIKSL